MKYALGLAVVLFLGGAYVYMESRAMQEVAGIYRMDAGSTSAEVTVVRDGARIVVRGVATYVTPSGDVRVGVLEDYVPGSLVVKDSVASVVHDGCNMSFIFMDSGVEVRTGGCRWGAGVDFAGVYERVR